MRGRLHLIAAQSLGRVESRIRMCDEVFAPDIESVAGRDADAAGQTDRLTEALHAYAGDPLQDAMRNGIRRGGVGAAENHHEFFAAVPADDVGLAQFGVNRLDDGAQTSIPRLMAEGIVDLLEMIQIDE